MSQYDDTGPKAKYNLDLPEDLRDKVMAKSRENNFPIAPLIRAHLENFVNEPIEESIKVIKKQQRRTGK